MAKLKQGATAWRFQITRSKKCVWNWQTTSGLLDQDSSPTKVKKGVPNQIVWSPFIAEKAPSSSKVIEARSHFNGCDPAVKPGDVGSSPTSGANYLQGTSTGRLLQVGHVPLSDLGKAVAVSPK